VAGEYKGFMIFGFENGKAAKVAFEGYATKTNRKKLLNAYSVKSKLVSIRHIPEDCDFYLTRGSDKAMVINTSLLTCNALKNSSGAQVFSLKKNSTLTSMIPASEAGGTPDELEFYRADKLPSSGHFILKKGKNG